MTALVPDYQCGYVTPVLVAEFIHYNFFQICPENSVLVCSPINLQDFAGAGVERAIAGFWPSFDLLASRRVERIVQGGIPVSARLGRKRTLALMDEAQRKSNIPCAADFEESIDALRQVGARRIAVAAKWDPSLMGDVAAYIKDAGGLEILCLTGDPHTAPEVVGLPPKKGHEIALALGRRAFAEAPEADALLLAGGAWQQLAAVIQLEQEFGRPVITNPTSTYWSYLKQMKMQPRRRGFSQLLDSLF